MIKIGLQSSQRFRYKSIAVGGTFDQIHKGHRALLSRAFECGETVYIGLTSDVFVKQSGKQIKHDFEARKKQLEEYVKAFFPSRSFIITKLEERFGPAIFSNEVEAITVSSETLSSIDYANQRRMKLGLPHLKVEVVPLILADDGKRISSTRIRAGEIDNEGHLRQ